MEGAGARACPVRKKPGPARIPTASAAWRAAGRVSGGALTERDARLLQRQPHVDKHHLHAVKTALAPGLCRGGGWRGARRGRAERFQPGGAAALRRRPAACSHVHAAVTARHRASHAPLRRAVQAAHAAGARKRAQSLSAHLHARRDVRGVLHRVVQRPVAVQHEVEVRRGADGHANVRPGARHAFLIHICLWQHWEGQAGAGAGGGRSRGWFERAGPLAACCTGGVGSPNCGRAAFQGAHNTAPPGSRVKGAPPARACPRRAALRRAAAAGSAPRRSPCRQRARPPATVPSFSLSCSYQPA
jgi:hypothetical protein